MWYKPYGSTGKSVSAIGFGGMRFRKITEEKVEYNYDDCAAVVLQARRQGINYFDTAPFYCDDQSEKIMGHAFRQMRAQGLGAPDEVNSLGLPPVYISTKSGEKDGGKLRAQLEESLRRIDVPRISFYHIWCILDLEDYQSRLVKGGAYEAAMRAKEEGLIEHVVFSTHCNGAEIQTIVNDGLFDGVTLGYNILNFRFRQQGLAAAKAKNIGVVTMNPLGGGVIPQRGETLGFLKASGDDSVIDAAVRFNASHREISVVLAGMGSVDEVNQNTRIGHELEKVSKTTAVLDDFVEERKTTLAEKIGQSLDTLCTGCQYCLPCPKEIAIPKFMLAYNDSLFGKPENTLNTLKWHWHLSPDLAASCIECGACESRCTQHLPIISRLKSVAQWGAGTGL